MFCKLEDANKSNDSQESQRSARLCSGTAHRRHDVEKCHIIRYDSCDVYDILEVFKKSKLARTRYEADDGFEREPRGTDGLDNEKRIEKIRQLSFLAVTS